MLAAVLKGLDRLVLEDVPEPQAIITHRFQLSDIHKAVEAMAQRDRNKVTINP